MPTKALCRLGLCLALLLSCQSVPGGKAPGASAASPRPSPSSGSAMASPEVIVPRKRPAVKALAGIRLPEPALPARTPAPPPAPSAMPSPTPIPMKASPSPKASMRPLASPSARPSPSASAKSQSKASAKPGPSAGGKEAPRTSPSPTFPPVPFSAIKSLSSEEMQKKAAYSLVVKRGTGFEIPLNGTAWTYIGTSGSAEGILYRNRKYEDSKVSFLFDPVVVGEYLLEFTRQDVLLDDIETVYVRVIVDPEDGIATLLPLDGQPSPSASASSAGALSASSPASTPSSSPLGGKTSSPAAVSSPGSASPAGAEDLDSYDGPGLLKKLQKDLGAGKTEAARADLESYKLRFPLGDEYLYWAARYYESPGPQRDILAARALYRRLMDEYPESPRYDEADARIEYIDKRYLEIR